MLRCSLPEMLIMLGIRQLDREPASGTLTKEHEHETRYGDLEGSWQRATTMFWDIEYACEIIT